MYRDKEIVNKPVINNLFMISLAFKLYEQFVTRTVTYRTVCDTYGDVPNSL